MKNWIIALCVALGLGASGGLLCARQTANKNEHKARIDAQTDLHRAETELALPAIKIQACEITKTVTHTINERVRSRVPKLRDRVMETRNGHDEDLADIAAGLNAVLSIR